MTGGACGKTVLEVGVPQSSLQFGTPRVLTELDTSYANQNPTLTADLLELFFTSGRGADSADVWTARRTSTQEPFGTPAIVSEISTSSFETSPAVSLDGLTLYYGSDRSGGLGEVDIWQVTRPDRATAWADLQNVAPLNSTAKDIPRPLGQHDLVMPLGSQRDSSVGYQTFLAARPATAQPFGTPTMVAGLASEQDAVADGFLTGDGLTLFYSVTPPDQSPDLFMATRPSTAAPFSQPTSLTQLNTDGEERDPWLSPDGATFFFSSDRGGNLQIYEVAVTQLPP
jgi:OOP family OmpA-OmpF porin